MADDDPGPQHRSGDTGLTQQALDFYTNILGFQETWRGSSNPDQLSWINLRVPDGTDYVELMAHIDGVLPGRVHRVFYESMVEDTESEVRRLLEYCGLPFEESCLRFYENDRAVRTASSEQVRQPIFREAMDHWRHYEPWLGPLKEALGAVLERYPSVPEVTSPV